MISSGAAPSCVEKSSEKRRAFFVDDKTQWSDIEACMAEALAVEKPEDADFGNAMGFYGVSKALLNCLTVQLARDHPTLKINACTRGRAGIFRLGRPVSAEYPRRSRGVAATRLVGLLA